MHERTISACEKYDAVRIDIREVPMGPFQGFPHRIPRCVVNILVPEEHLDNEALLAISKEQKDRVLSFGKQYNAMAFHFWTPKQKVGKEEAIAIVDYAPAGLWEEAVSAKIGDYTAHAFKVIVNLTKGDDDEVP